MTEGRTLRIIGAIALAVGGLFAALGPITQFALLASAKGGDSYTYLMGAVSRVASAVGFVGSLFLLAAFILLSLARGRRGVSDGSALPRVGFIVLAVVFALAQVFFFVAPLFYSASNSALIFPANRAVNVLFIAALLFAAIAVLVKGAFGGFARLSLFLPAALLILAQFPILTSYAVYLLPQAVYLATWVVVAVSYLLAKPRGAAVTVASENLAE